MTTKEIIILIAIIIAQAALLASVHSFGRTDGLKMAHKTFRAFMDNLNLDSVNEFCKSKHMDECEELAVKRFVIDLFEKVRERI